MKYKEYEWVRKVVLSCETMMQSYAAEKLIRLFDEKYKDFELARSLRDLDFFHSQSLVKLK